MFRQAARYTARVAATQQRRAYSSSNAEKAGFGTLKLTGLILGATLAYAAYEPNRTLNAGLFSSAPVKVDIRKVRSDIVAAIEAEDTKRGKILIKGDI